MDLIACQIMDNGGAPAAASAQVMNQDNWNRLTAYVQSLGAEVEKYQAELDDTKRQLAAARAQISGAGSTSAKPYKPSPFSGKVGTIDSWCAHMDSYLTGTDPAEAVRIACTYLEGEAFSWWHTYRDQADVKDWTTLRAALVRRFNPLNKVQAARNKLHSWRQIKDVGAFNKSFLAIVLDIPDITEEEKIDRYSRGLKRDIWERLCTKSYEDLESLMTDALRVEAALAGSSRVSPPANPPKQQAGTGAAPMDLSSVKVEKLTPEERQRCMREGLCLRCRAKGHLAKDCPKGRRN